MQNISLHSATAGGHLWGIGQHPHDSSYSSPSRDPTVETFASKSQPCRPPCLVHPLLWKDRDEHGQNTTHFTVRRQRIGRNFHYMDETTLKAWEMVGSWKISVWDTPHSADGLQTFLFFIFEHAFKTGNSPSYRTWWSFAGDSPCSIGCISTSSNLLIFSLDCWLTSAFLWMKQPFLVDQPSSNIIKP